MVNADISNIWGEISLPDLLGLEREVFDAHMLLTNKTGRGADMLGWMALPDRMTTTELQRIRQAAERIRGNSEVLVVVGIGGSYLGARAAIELLRGQQYNLTGHTTQILFAGNSFSTRSYQELMELLSGRDFSVVLISKSGTTMEPALAARSLRWMLEQKYGAQGARERIYAITDPRRGALQQMATEAGWETFPIPPDVGGRYSVLSAVGLLPMAVAGIDPGQVLLGGSEARRQLDIRSFENPAWLYAAARTLLYRGGKAIEILCSWEPRFASFGRWWQQLFGESEGKEGKGLFPTCLEFSADLHSMGQLLQQGQRNLFETVVRFAPPEQQVAVEMDWKDLDGLNYLQGKTLEDVAEQAYQGTVAAHVDGGVPVITLEAGPTDAGTLGELFYFFELSCALSAYMLGVNPFNQPGVEQYKENMYTLLGKPKKG
jgi:glucose-6-phosphate isomerase